MKLRANGDYFVGNEKEDYFQPLFEGFSTIEEAAWDEMLGSFNISADVGSQERHVYTSNENVRKRLLHYACLSLGCNLHIVCTFFLLKAVIS